MFRRPFLLLTGFIFSTAAAAAEPLSKKTDIDFFRDVPSRNLKGLASRSDGRLVAGPTLREIVAPAPADLLWSLEPTPNASQWLVGSGPDGRILEVTLDAANHTFTSREVAKLDDPQVFAVRRLPDGTLLAGTSPRGALYLLRDGKPIARVALPVDSIFDLLLVPGTEGNSPTHALIATGNPARIYKLDLQKFASVGLIADKITDAKILADRGITLFGEIRDRNARRLALLPDGRVAAGSAPRGNIYTFPAAGGAPVILQENRDAEVTDLQAQPNGDLFATIVFTSTSNESRITPPASAPKPELPPPAQSERFSGRSSLVWFPANGFPETLTSRNNTAFYRFVRRGDMLLIVGGEMGELVGYDLKARLSLTFSGSISSQLNAIAPIAGSPDKFLVLRNNAPGFALLDFSANGPREAETRRIDLGTPSQIGALRFNRLRNLTEGNLAPELRTSNGSDDVEGWSAWTPLKLSADAGWRAENLRGRHVKLRLRVLDAAVAQATATALGQNAPQNAKSESPASAPTALSALELDRATLFGLPQNRRPQLQDFRVLTPGFGVIPAVEQPPSAVTSLSQLVQTPKEEDRRRNNFLSSQVVPTPGSQVVLWTLADPDGDQLVSTFSIRRDGDTDWIDLVRQARESYAQFDTRHLPDGVYFTRLVATEIGPRPAGDRLSQTFETDDLIIDHSAPEILEATARRAGDSIVVSLRGRDRLSLLEGIEVVFNSGQRETLEQTADGIRDGREESFTLDIPLARVSQATSLEVTLYDAAGNSAARRLTW